VFDFPSPDTLKPPMIKLEGAAVGYEGGKPILKRLNLRVDPDERMALLGRNGNGKTTLARLLSRQLPTMEGEMVASGKMRAGYFAQHQVEELDVDETPLQHMTRQMPDAKPTAVRAQLGRFGFSGDKVEVKVKHLSGGERARLSLALITRDAPHMLILDEPTNHLDVDAREALVQALNEYEGAVVVVSHDRHLLELTADRLVLVANGTADEFDGSLEDYRDFVLGRGDAASAEKPARKTTRKDERRTAAEARARNQALRNALKQVEAEMTKLTAERSDIDRALFDPAGYQGRHKGRKVTDLMRLRADVEQKLTAAEARWMEAAEALEQAEADAA
jgi:ATP-binding cassette, subfamily F, member 3